MLRRSSVVLERSLVGNCGLDISFVDVGAGRPEFETVALVGHTGLPVRRRRSSQPSIACAFYRASAASVAASASRANGVSDLFRNGYPLDDWRAASIWPTCSRTSFSFAALRTSPPRTFASIAPTRRDYCRHGWQPRASVPGSIVVVLARSECDCRSSRPDTLRTTVPESEAWRRVQCETVWRATATLSVRARHRHRSGGLLVPRRDSDRVPVDSEAGGEQRLQRKWPSCGAVCAGRRTTDRPIAHRMLPC
jgi:hypothetical protein